MKGNEGERLSEEEELLCLPSTGRCWSDVMKFALVGPSEPERASG